MALPRLATVTVQEPKPEDNGALVAQRRLKRHSFVPLYLQIRDDIVDQIRKSELPPGTRLPSEPEMTRAYGVGRPTVRQAIDALRREGLVATVRGSGTFVAQDVNRISLLGFDGLTKSLRARGMEPVDQIISADLALPPLDVLEVDSPPEGWWVVERVRSLPGNDGDQPFCVETDAFNLAHCPDAAELFERSGSASAVLDDGHGFAIARCDVATRAEKASKMGVASSLQVAPGHPVLVMERLNWSLTQEPIHAVRFVVLTNRVPIVEGLVNASIMS